MRAQPDASYLPTLDGWRAIAILMVVFNHSLRPAVCMNVEPGQSYLCNFILIGGYGVALFFGLSGFLITTRLLDEHDRHGAISLKRFYLRRVFRILPAALLMLAVVAILGALQLLPVAPIEIWSSVFFFRNYVPLFLPHNSGMYTTQYWSLAVEEHFYLLWPLLLVIGLRYRRALHIAVAGVVLIAVWRRLDGHFRWLEHVSNIPSYQFLFRTDTRLDAILYGCILALLLRDADWRSWLEKLAALPVWFLLLALYVAGIATQHAGVLWYTILSTLLIVGTLLRPQTFVARALEFAPLRWIGRVSYSLYLWHPLVMPQYLGAQRFPMLQSWPWNVLLALILTVVSYYLVEKPMVRYGHRITRTSGH